MPRKRRENPKQLRLFMNAEEVMSQYRPNWGDFEEVPDEKSTSDLYEERLETPEEVWSRKAEKADEQGLTESLRHHGMVVPVSLDDSRRQVRGGHHRVAAMSKINKHQFFPVMYNDTVNQAAMEENKFLDTLDTKHSEIISDYDYGSF
jgi:hypothetical protein